MTTEQKIAQGNPGHEVLQEKLSPNSPIAPPAAPDWLSGTAGMVWDRLAPVAATNGYLADVDAEAFAQLCNAAARVGDLESIITANGTTYEARNAQGDPIIRPRPEVAQSMAYYREYRALCREFGLTAASRCRIPADLPDDDDDDFLDDLD